MNRIDVVEGAVSGKLTVIRIHRDNGKLEAEVKCECGNVKNVSKSNFASGKTTTCGCGPRGKPFEKEHGYGGTPAYNSWKKMMSRCYDPLNKDYRHYGGRGIAVCKRWHNVKIFIADMGQREKGFSLERIDVDKEYAPWNCIWLPHNLQPKNRTNWRHTEAGLLAISRSRMKDWRNGVYDAKVVAQQTK
jgi:hypothetical protein